jgi:hypothetical protein
VEKLVTALRNIADVLASLNADSRVVKKAINILIKPTKSADPARKAAPSAYNLFIQRTMPKVRADHPEASAKERMRLCALLWRENKALEQEQEENSTTQA